MKILLVLFYHNDVSGVIVQDFRLYVTIERKERTFEEAIDLKDIEELIERGILVGVNLKKDEHFDYSMEELANLADALKVEVVGMVTQNLERVTPSHYVGTGKIEEIKAFYEEADANHFHFKRIEVKTGIAELGYVQITLLDETVESKNIVRKGAYYLQSHLIKNEGGGGHDH